MPGKRRGEDREIESLKTRRRKAQQKNDLAEESKLCNAIGEVYMRKGNYVEALQYHRMELGLSEAVGDTIGTAIAHRRVGECLCELEEYEEALQHQQQHLSMARDKGDPMEEQRALATLGRTYFIQSQSSGVGEEEARELRVNACNANLKSLDLCDKLSGTVPDRELLEMRCRLYLNLGLVHENSGDLHSAKKFMEKALSISKELGDSATVLHCHHSLGSLYLREGRPALALRSLREAVGVACEQHSWQQEAEVLREMSQAQLLMSNFDEAKSCLKKVVRLYHENSQLAETGADQKRLNTVKKVIHYSLEMEALGGERAVEKMKMCERLGDLCCSVRAFPAAVRFYEQQLSLAEAHGLDPKDLSPVLVSLARTHNDCRQYKQALSFYQRELELRRGSPSEECDTWSSIAAVRDSSGAETAAVMEAYEEAFRCAGGSGSVKLKVDVCRAVVRLCKRRKCESEQLERWEGELEGLLEEHPDLPLESGGDSDSDSQGVGGFETPESLSEMESGEEEEEEEVVEVDDRIASSSYISSRTRGLTRRKKSRLLKRNEKGETLLHVAAISGNLVAARQLILEGADVNMRDHCGWIPLHEACNHGHTELVELLLDSGSDVNDPGGERCEGVTPLIDSANNGHLEIVRLLVQRGADIFQKDARGNMAVDVAREKMSSSSESSEPYELGADHAAVREYLVEEMEKRGWTEEDSVAVTPIESGGSRCRSLSVSRSREDIGGGTHSWKRMSDRTGRSILLSDDDNDDEDPPVSTKSLLPERDKWTHGGAALKTNPSNGVSTLQSRDSNRQLKRPFTPALILEGRAECSGTTGAHPIIDHWLEDDVGRPQLKRRKARDPFSSHPESSSGSRRSLSLSSNRTGTTSRARQKTLYGSASTIRNTAHTTVGGVSGSGGGDVGTSVEFTGEVVSVESSPEGTPHRQHTLTSHTPTQSHHHLPSNDREHSTPASRPTVLPLRIRVRIQTKSYLVPCPARLSDGSESTIQWLATQAAERYFTQHGVRPLLSLSTSDGALLSGSDVVAHVLQSGEEVVGEAEHWHLPPLSERYQTSCSSSGLKCNRRVLEVFRGPTNLSVMDLSHLSLQPAHLPPLLSSLHTHSPLTSLTLSGNRLKIEGLSLLTNTLCFHPNLRLLDLSCTGLTPQGLETLCSPSSSPSPSSHPLTPSPNLKPWVSLRQLLLGHNPLGGDCGPALSSLLSLTSDLRELRLESCGLGGGTLDRHTGLTHTLNSLSNLSEVVVSLNPLGPAGLLSLLHSLPTDHLSSLDLSNTCTNQPLTATLEEPRVVYFFSQVSTRLECLCVSHCPLEMSTLTRLLQNCRHLRELRLAAVGLTSHSAQPLSRLVEGCVCLRLLDVSGNEGLASDGCLQLLQCCKTRGEMKMDLRSCGIHSPLPTQLRELLSELVARRRVEIVGNDFDFADFSLIFPKKGV